MVNHYARKTKRLIEAQRIVGFITGGEVGSRLTLTMAFPTSSDSLLRLIRSYQEPKIIAPEYLGIDDWAIRKNMSYGTILVDLETHQPIDVLPDRTTGTLSKWFHDHPGSKVVSRDRSGAYIEAINQGAPEAIQVADRWHLLHNLTEVVERVLTRRYRDLLAACKDVDPAEQASQPEEPVHVDSGAIDQNNVPQTKTNDENHRIRYQKRQVEFDQVRDLYQKGMGIRQIGRTLRMSREKIRKYLHNNELPEYKRRKTATILDPYWEYIEKRWKEGERNGMQLWKEILAMGYSGSYMSLARQVRKLRAVMPRETKRKASLPTPKLTTPTRRPFTPRQTAWLYVRKPEELTDQQSSYLKSLSSLTEEYHHLYLLVQEYRRIFQERKKDDFSNWLILAETSKIAEIRNFARGLRKDQRAVEAALEYHWSNGPVEGQNNRLKMIKRQMYGRANFDLLRLRVLYS